VQGKLKKEKSVYLRQIKQSDLELIRDWRNLEKVRAFAGQYLLLNMRNQKEWYNEIKSGKRKDKMFMIMGDKKPIGLCGLTKIDNKNKNANIAIFIAEEKLRNKGLGKNVLRKLVDYGFNKQKLHRINAEIFEYNENSKKLFESLNFRLEVILRDSLWRFGKWWETYYFAILNEKIRL